MKRKYSTLKLFHNKPLEILLTENEDDFQVRRALIDEYEDELHVCFSWRKLFEWISYGLILLSVLTIMLPVSKIIFPFSILSFLASIIFKNKFSKKVRYYIMSIGFIDNAIYKKYNIVLPPLE